MIHEEKDSYTVSCWHDPDKVCCLDCQERDAKCLIYKSIPRNKWPLWLQDKFQDITKEQLEKELELYRKSPERTNSLLQKILNSIQDSLFF